MVHGRTDIIHIAISRNHDTFHGRIAHLVDLREQRQAIHLRHVDVAQDNVKIRMLQNHLECLQSVVRERKLILALADFSSEVLC